MSPNSNIHPRPIENYQQMALQISSQIMHGFHHHQQSLDATKLSCNNWPNATSVTMSSGGIDHQQPVEQSHQHQPTLLHHQLSQTSPNVNQYHHRQHQPQQLVHHHAQNQHNNSVILLNSDQQQQVNSAASTLMSYSMYSYDLNDEFSDILSAPSTPEPHDIYADTNTDQLMLSCELIYQNRQQQQTTNLTIDIVSQQLQQPQPQPQQQPQPQSQPQPQPQETCSILMQSMWQPLSPPESSHYEGASPRSSYSVATPASSYCSASPSPPISSSSYSTSPSSTVCSATTPYLFTHTIQDTTVVRQQPLQHLHHHHHHHQQQQQQHQQHQVNQQQQLESHISKCDTQLALVKIENSSMSETSSDLLLSPVDTANVPTHHHVPHHRSSPIHLWEFLKELLQQQQQEHQHQQQQQQQQQRLIPSQNKNNSNVVSQQEQQDNNTSSGGGTSQNSTIIRWLDRQKGVFKIEDSVRVAKLWGKRKNKPKMNYDKLSRSIRQYYKKGIMKKTDRSQRLVYQFCPAYCQ